jgi:hypothetical protein
MRVFISVYPGFTLAIPMDAVASMVLYNQKTEKTVQYDPKNRSTYVSLPWLFNMSDQAVPHGVVMREWNTKENKVVLLTAEVKRDIEIPDEEFHPIPKALGATRFSAMFSGIKFSDNPILLLNVEQLLKVIQDKQWVLDKSNSQEPQTSPQGEVSPLEPQPSLEGVEPEVRGSPPAPQPSPKSVEPEVRSSPITPQTSPKDVEPEVRSSPLAPQPSAKPVEPEVRDSPIAPQPSPKSVEPETSEPSLPTPDEVIEFCEVIEEPPINLSVISEASLSTPDEIIEICEVIDESPISLSVNSETFSLTVEPQPSAKREGSPLVSQTSPQGEVSPLALDEIIELCEPE